MYPAELLALFPPFPRGNRVFVAMSFDPRFASRWEQVIRPGIESVALDGVQLEAHRVDARAVSDSILTEIVKGISEAALFVADVTTVGYADQTPARNPNVMYEVGIAHASRMPEEVLLFRSDADPLVFDLANVRVNKYEPEADVPTAVGIVRDAVSAALREVDLRRSFAVQQVVSVFGADLLEAVFHVRATGTQPPMPTMGDMLVGMHVRTAIQGLLDHGVLRAIVQPDGLRRADPSTSVAWTELVTYELTSFGQVVIAELGARLGVAVPHARCVSAAQLPGSMEGTTT